MKKFLKVFAILFFVFLFLGTLVFLWNQTRPKVINYDIVESSRDTLMSKTIATGKIDPRDEVLIKPQISGIISEIYCEAGQMIKKGDIIAQIKVIPEMGALNSAASRVSLGEISLSQAEKEYNRIANLYSSGVITIEEFEKGETALKRSKEELQNAKNNLEIVENGMISGSTSLSNTQIRATVSGMILDVPIKVGNSVILTNNFNEGTTIATIANLSDMLFVGDVDETEIGKLKEGMNAEIIIGALQNVKLNAVLEYISPKASLVSGIIVFQIKAAVNIPDSTFIRAGYSANASIITKRLENVLAIPESVVKFTEDGTGAYVEVLTSEPKSEKQTFEIRDIEIGFSNGVKVEVLSGLDGTEKLKGNIKIKKIKS